MNLSQYHLDLVSPVSLAPDSDCFDIRRLGLSRLATKICPRLGGLTVVLINLESYYLHGRGSMLDRRARIDGAGSFATGSMDVDEV